jgi:hypothetical protein
VVDDAVWQGEGTQAWLSDAAVAGAKKLGHLNPQTAETSFALKGN